MQNNKGFTLIEMLVSVGLLTLLGIFIATTYTVVTQMNAEIFVTRKYLHESVENYENGKYIIDDEKYTKTPSAFEIKIFEKESNLVCDNYLDKQNGLYYFDPGNCHGK